MMNHRVYLRAAAVLGALVGVSILPQAATAHHGSTHTAQLVSIKCVRVHDAVGRDEPYIKLNGANVWAGRDFRAGVSANLLDVAPVPFTGRISMELWEDDKWPSRDDYLGENIILDTLAGQGEYTAVYGGGGWQYEITYRVN